MIRPSRLLSVMRRTLRRDYDTLAFSVLLGGLISVGVLTLMTRESYWLYLLPLPVMLAMRILRPRQLPWMVSAMLLTLVWAVPIVPLDGVLLGVLAIVFCVAFWALESAFRRSSVGVAGPRGDSMLVDLRDRLLSHGAVPDLPEEWAMAWDVHSAGRTAFAGDFVVTSLTDAGTLEVVVVDVAGSGEIAATRALVLAGAMGGLIGAVPPCGLLHAVNSYMNRADWEDGFATAVHLSVNVSTGAYAVRSAGHPPALLGGVDGRWRALEACGPALGVLEDPAFSASEGVLEPGETLVLYTDGLVEGRRLGLVEGIDLLTSNAQEWLGSDVAGAPQRMIHGMGDNGDDRLVLVVGRS